MKHYPFVTVDVFTSTALKGNQLAVFTDARGLSAARMQDLAREMKLSETTFVLPRASRIEAAGGVKVRIFTVESELRFAGHPTLGTAFVLRAATDTGEVNLDLPVGKIPVRFSTRRGRAFGEMTQADPEFGMVHRRSEIARVCGISPDAIETDPPIETVSTGNGFVIVPIRSLETVRKLEVDWRRIAQYAGRHDASFFYFVTRQTENPAASLHARMIFFGGEDPATGSAAGPAVAWMVKHGLAQSDQLLLIEQGIEAKRASEIFARATLAGTRVTNVRVGGHVVEVSRGTFTL